MGKGPDEAARVMVAHLFQRSGRREMSESELANAASLDLSWFPPKQAREIVAGLVRSGLLQRTDEGELEPSFDVRSMKVPLGFRPPEGILSSLPPPGAVADRPVARGPPGQGDEGGPGLGRRPEGKEGPPAADREAARQGQDPRSGAGTGKQVDLGGLLETFAQASGEEVGVWVERMEQVVQESGDSLLPEAALLVAGGREGLEVSGLAGRWRESLETPTQ